MVTIDRSKADVRDLLRVLAMVGLEHRVHPLLDHDGSATNRLFAIQDDYEQREAAFHRFEKAFENTPAAELGPGDARIYRRERERRYRQLVALSEERQNLLEAYAEELMDSPRHHEKLAPIYDDLGLEI